MTYMTRTIALALCLIAPQITLAQETAAPAEAPTAEAPAADNGLSMGAEVTGNDGVGSTYTAETFTDWQMRCVRTAEGNDPCQMYQLLHDEQGNAVGEINIFGLPAGQTAAAGATFVAPLETLLPQQVTLEVDAGTAKRYPFTWCAQLGCVSRIGFLQAEVDAFKRGNKATITIVPAVAPDQRVKLDMSLKGFTAAYDAVNKANGN
jgi:invasion protein IalB